MNKFKNSLKKCNHSNVPSLAKGNKPFAGKAGKGTTNYKIQEVEAAERLGVDLNKIQINNGIAKTEIKITSEINYSDVKLLVEYAKSKGTQKVEVSSGYIANEKLMGFLGKELLMESLLWEEKLFEETQA